MKGTCLNSPNQFHDAISRIRFSPLSNNLLASSWDSSLRLYDVDSCKLRLEASSDGEANIDCCFESESFALSATSSGSILRYDMHLGNTKELGRHDDTATCVEYSDETYQVISAGWDKQVKFWDARASNSTGGLRNFDMEIESISLSDYKLMVALKSSIHEHDLRYSDQSVQEHKFFSGIHVKCVRSCKDLQGFAVGSTDGTFSLGYFRHSDSTNEGYTFRCHSKSKGMRHHVSINDITFNPVVPGIFITGDYEGRATIWDVPRKRRIKELPRYPNSIASLAYNRDGQILAVASSFTYQKADEREDPPQIFVHHLDGDHIRSSSANQ